MMDVVVQRCFFTGLKDKREAFSNYETFPKLLLEARLTHSLSLLRTRSFSRRGAGTCQVQSGYPWLFVESISAHLVKSTDPGASLAGFISHLHCLLSFSCYHHYYLVGVF